MNRIFAVIAVVATTQVAGCADMLGYGQPKDGSPEYKAGYWDGCKSGRDTENYGRITKNVDSYRDVPDYKIGWDDAYAHCRESARNLNRTLGF